MTERTLPIDYKVHARITSGRALPAEIAEIMAQLDKTTPGWRNAIRDVCDVQIPLPAYEIAPHYSRNGQRYRARRISLLPGFVCRDRRLGRDFRRYSAMQGATPVPRLTPSQLSNTTLDVAARHHRRPCSISSPNPAHIE